MIVTCHHCGASVERCAGHVNRALAIGAKLFCNRVCFGLDRRAKNPPTSAEKKAAKRLYDQNRRTRLADRIKKEKRAYYLKNHEAIEAKHKVYRKKHMARHVAYCQRPEYRAWKQKYDRSYLAGKHYGDFAEAALALRSLESVIEQRASRYTIMLTNSTINKAQTRRRAL